MVSQLIVRELDIKFVGLDRDRGSGSTTAPRLPPRTPSADCATATPQACPPPPARGAGMAPSGPVLYYRRMGWDDGNYYRSMGGSSHRAPPY